MFSLNSVRIQWLPVPFRDNSNALVIHSSNGEMFSRTKDVNIDIFLEKYLIFVTR